MPSLRLSGHPQDIAVLARALEGIAIPPSAQPPATDSTETVDASTGAAHVEPAPPEEALPLARADGRGTGSFCWYAIGLDRLGSGALCAEIRFRRLGHEESLVRHLETDTLDSLIAQLEAYDPEEDVPPLPGRPEGSTLAEDLLAAIEHRRLAAEATYQYRGLLGELLLAIEAKR